MRRIIILSAFLLIPFAVSIAARDKGPVSREEQYEAVAQQIKLFGDVYREINRNYVEEVDVHDFIRAGIDGMLSTLDPYTVFFEPNQMDELEILTTGQYGGVGIEIGLRGRNRELTVISPIEDTPAARKGIRAGDVIIKIDGISTAGFTTADAAKHIRGPEGTDVTLTIRREGFDQPLDYVLTRANIRMHDVAYAGMIEDEIGYIKLVRFSNNAPNEFIDALRDILRNRPRGLVLDLRSNPGGLLPSAVEIAQQFLNEGDLVVSTRGRTPRSERQFRAVKTGMASDVPLVVLVNGGSASASEIVAGAVQDLDRGIIIGTPTFGKGLVQSVVKLSDGAALKVTTARYYTPSGRCIQKDRSREEEEAMMVVSEIDLEAATLMDTTQSDSTVARFITRAGRLVYGGGGVTPDVEVAGEPADPVGVEMYRRDLFFAFVRQWLATHPADTVQVTADMVQAFYAFADSAGFVYPNPAEKYIEELKRLGEREKMGGGFFSLIEDLRSSLDKSSKPGRPELDAFVRQSLDREMASALGGRAWRIRSTFDEDLTLKEAIALLNDPAHYAALLQPPSRADAAAPVR